MREDYSPNLADVKQLGYAGGMWTNPRKPTVKKSHASADLEARLEAAETQDEMLLRREPHLWDVRDVGDKLVGLIQRAEEDRAEAAAPRSAGAADRAVADGRPRSEYWYYTFDSREHTFRQQYDDLFHRWFLASPRGTSRAAEAAGVSAPEQWHREALAAPFNTIQHEWHAAYEQEAHRTMPLIDEWRDLMQPPLIRLDTATHSTQVRTGLPGSIEWLYVGYYTSSDIDADVATKTADAVASFGEHIVRAIERGLPDCAAHGWSLVYRRRPASGYYGSQRLTLLVRLPDARIAVFETWARRRSVGLSFDRWKRSGRQFGKLHFHKPEFYENVHWERAPSLQTDVPLVAMIELDNAGIILPQAVLEQQVRDFNRQQLFEESLAALRATGRFR